MRPLHIAASLLIAATWGLNFTVIRFGLDEFTPLAFAGWRFVLGALPVLVLPRPAISWKALAGTGIFLFAGQFVFLFLAMEAGLPPGLSSVLVQLQGPLTVVLAALFLRERATPGQWAGLAVALIGVIVIGRSVEGSTEKESGGFRPRFHPNRQSDSGEAGTSGGSPNERKGTRTVLFRQFATSVRLHFGTIFLSL